MKENLYNLACLILVASAVFVFGCDAHAQTSPVKVEVTPKAAAFDPDRPITFRFRWVIEPNENNRLYALVYGCGKELHSSQREINGDSAKTYERYVQLTVVGECNFMACVVRMVEGKPKTICSHYIVRILGEEEP